MNHQVRQLFKQLLYMGKEYPQELGGYLKFSRVLKKNFRTTEANDEHQLTKALEKGQYIIKELEALYFLRKYRYLKRVYK